MSFFSDEGINFFFLSPHHLFSRSLCVRIIMIIKSEHAANHAGIELEILVKQKKKTKKKKKKPEDRN